MVSLLSWWSDLYSNSAGLRTAVEFAHVGGLVLGGGAAIAADRMTLVAERWDAIERRAHLGTLRHTHEMVLVGLVVLMTSGLLLLGSDLGTFLYSKVFWIKMVLIVALLGNGWRVWAAGNAALLHGASDLL